MNIQSVQSAEIYKIRKQSQEQKAEQLSTEQEQTKVDEYDKANPAGEEVEGIYNVSHDDEGNLKVDYKQPETKATQAATSIDASEDDELEELKEQRNVIRQQLNRETDEAVKSQLRVQLQSIEAQIALKSSVKQ